MRNDQILTFFEDRNGNPINSTISVWTWAWPPLLCSNINSLLLSNWAPWNNREKKWKDAKSIFQRRFHGCRRCRIVRSLVLLLKRQKFDVYNTSSSVSISILMSSGVNISRIDCLVRCEVTTTCVLWIQMTNYLWLPVYPSVACSKRSDSREREKNSWRK